MKKTIKRIIIITISIPIILISLIIINFEYQMYQQTEAAKKIFLERNPQITEVIEFWRTTSFMEGENYSAIVIIDGEECWIDTNKLGTIKHKDCGPMDIFSN